MITRAYGSVSTPFYRFDLLQTIGIGRLRVPTNKYTQATQDHLRPIMCTQATLRVI